LQYAKDTGADRGGNPDFDADITEQELLFALRLIVQKCGYEIPIRNNGLGYNNLLFMALILAKIQIESSSVMGDNAKVFSVLAIEEPEAHLHPSLQSQFLRFLKRNLEEKRQVRQIFITTHSTHITSAVGLDTLICLYHDDKDFQVGYPAKVFEAGTPADKSSRIYVERFLDATKSNMLFADRVILVEGLSEQLLLPCFARYLGLEDELTNKHVCILSVNSRTFKHFLKLYAYHHEDRPFAINKKIVCITDADPSKKIGNRWRSVFPFELASSEDDESLSRHVCDLKNSFESLFENIHIFHPEVGKGKTFEYEVCRSNPTSKLLITQCFLQASSAHTQNNYIKLIENFNESFDDLIKKYMEILKTQCIAENRIVESLYNCTWDDTEKKKALIAAVYYTIIKNAKGENAFYLEENLRANLELKTGGEKFNIPEYIEMALKKAVE
jgi:hypothetical protein